MTISASSSEDKQETDINMSVSTRSGKVIVNIGTDLFEPREVWALTPEQARGLASEFTSAEMTKSRIKIELKYQSIFAYTWLSSQELVPLIGALIQAATTLSGDNEEHLSQENWSEERGRSVFAAASARTAIIWEKGSPKPGDDAVHLMLEDGHGAVFDRKGALTGQILPPGALIVRGVALTPQEAIDEDIEAGVVPSHELIQKALGHQFAPRTVERMAIGLARPKGRGRPQEDSFRRDGLFFKVLYEIRMRNMRKHDAMVTVAQQSNLDVETLRRLMGGFRRLDSAIKTARIVYGSQR